jgi:hypothetical protein
MGKKIFKEGEEPQHVAQGLPQTKEKKQPMIGEKLIKYLEDIGLKHAAYVAEDGSVKVIGLNKKQVREAINNIVIKSELKKFVENGLEESEEGDRIQKINNRIKALKQKLSDTNSTEQKKLFQNRLKNALQTLSNIKKGYGIKAPHNEIGLPVGTGVNLPGGSINGAPSEDDVNKMKDKLGRNKSVNEASEPEIISQLKDIINNQQYQSVKDPKTGKKIKVDMQTASVVLNIYNGLSNVNKDNMIKMGLLKMIEVSFKILSRYK